MVELTKVADKTSLNNTYIDLITLNTTVTLRVCDLCNVDYLNRTIIFNSNKLVTCQLNSTLSDNYKYYSGCSNVTNKISTSNLENGDLIIKYSVKSPKIGEYTGNCVDNTSF